MVRKSLPAVSELTSESFDEFSTSEKVVVIGYFDDAESDEYKVFEKAAKNLSDDYTFGAVLDSKLAKKHKVKVPAVVVHKKFDEPTADVEYNEDHKALVKDIKSAATPLIGDIGPQNYASYVESKLPLAYIFIETEEHREEYEPIFKPIAKEHKGDINFVFINATMFGRQAEVINLEQKFPAFGIQQLEPAAKFPFDQSNDITEKAVAKFVKDFAAGKLEPSVKSEPIPEGKDGNTTVLVAKNFVDVVLDKTKDVLVEFYAPWCGHCKRLAPIYDELAALYPEDSNVVVAKFDAIANDVPVGVDVEIQGFPTIKLFKAKDNTVVDFEGERTVEGFVNFLNDNADSKFEPELPASEDESEEKEDAEEEEL
jgi:protein disulfide-isomerase A1